MKTLPIDDHKQGIFFPNQGTFFQFLKKGRGYHHFKKSTFYNDMMPSARFFTSAKTHKFENFDDINIKELKLRPIIDHTGTCY